LPASIRAKASGLAFPFYRINTFATAFTSPVGFCVLAIPFVDPLAVFAVLSNRILGGHLATFVRAIKGVDAPNKGTVADPATVQPSMVAQSQLKSAFTIKVAETVKANANVANGPITVVADIHHQNFPSNARNMLNGTTRVIDFHASEHQFAVTHLIFTRKRRGLDPLWGVTAREVGPMHDRGNGQARAYRTIALGRYATT
jgi:hypothetical protein